ncbi:Disease resistance protein RPM1 [Triticum urartu]|uniref:Disease resistance protein RPM1 n=1 Tax=Triticum urartu TaxID=4572 RepID=M7YIY7_TRIUA|nr:Disease resistance protein RPM1 [Triticum urartu]
MEAVAKAASVYFVHHMDPLKPEDSKKLFVKRVFGSIEEGTYPNGLEEHMKTILKKCGGLPLAIVSIASLLASYTSAEDTVMWERVSRSIGSHMESHPTLEGMRQLITLSYDYLPHHLKACMMYLSIFPEDFVVAKDRLLYRWIAEGLVTEKRGLTLLEVAEEYFNELISRNMIQLDKFVSIEDSVIVEVVGCRVHDMILEVMVSKSKESKFVSLVGRQYGGMPHGHGKVRRLSIHDNDHDEQRPKQVERRHVRHGFEAIKLQHVRSLTTFQYNYGLGKLLDRLGEFKLLRVLDLEDCKALRSKHLRDVCQLYLLRFLSLRGTDVSKMPSNVGNLEHLEYLDARSTYIGGKLPQTLTKLSKLERLKCTGWFLARGLVNMKALREVDMAVLTGDDVEVAKEIGDLPQLQMLSVQIGYQYKESELKEGVLSALASSLSKKHTLRSLNLTRWDGSLEFLHDVSPPPLLQCLSVFGQISQLPDWISSLTHLTKFEVGRTELAGDQLFGVLCKLPNLQSVKLVVIECKNGELVAGTEHIFPALRILEVLGCPTVLTFEKGSMTKLETLVLRFVSTETRIVGLKNLEKLKEVKLSGWKGNPAMKRAVEQLKDISTESNPIKVVVD